MKSFATIRLKPLKFLLAGLLLFFLYPLLPERNTPLRQQIFTTADYSPFVLNHFTIGMNPADFTFWFSDRPHSFFVFQPAELTINRLPAKYRADIRIKGTHAWNWDFRKPSFRIRIKGQKFRRNDERVDLINPDDASMLANLVADNIAVALGLPCPRTRLCTLTLNHDYKGLYHLAEPMNVVTLGNQGFINHSLLEGNIRNSKMWLHPELWTCESTNNKNTQRAQKTLEMLLNKALTPVQLDKIVDLSEIVDFSKTANWSALMSAIASIHTNDFLGNLLVFDETSGRIFPAIADSTGFGVITAMAGKHGKIDIEVPPYEFLTPLFNALFRIPEFQFQRNQALYKLLQHELQPQNFKKLVDSFLIILRPLFGREPYASALINVPLVLFSRKIPVSAQTQLEDAERLLEFMKARRQFLLDQLEETSVKLFELQSQSSSNAEKIRFFALQIKGHCPIRLDLGDFRRQLLPDADFDGKLDQVGKDWHDHLILYPALKEVKREMPHWLLLDRRFAGFLLEPDYQTYIFGVAEESFSNCIEKIRNHSINAVTGTKVSVAQIESGLRENFAPAPQVLHSWRTLPDDAN